MHLLIILALLGSALYCAGAYAYCVVQVYQDRPGYTRELAAGDTFRLGLCFIVAVGFLGLYLK